MKNSSQQILSVNALAQQTGRDRRTITGALQDVKPDGKTKQGSPGWLLKTALAALGAGGNGQIERARLDKARAELAELELARKRGELLPIEDVEEMMQRVATTVRTNLLGVPAKVTPLVVGKKGEAQVEGIIRTAIDDALLALTEMDRSGA